MSSRPRHRAEAQRRQTTRDEDRPAGDHGVPVFSIPCQETRTERPTGTTETIAAASSGEFLQPSISMITSRKSAPVSPAESRPSAASGASWSRPAGPG